MYTAVDLAQWFYFCKYQPGRVPSFRPWPSNWTAVYAAVTTRRHSTLCWGIGWCQKGKAALDTRQVEVTKSTEVCKYSFYKIPLQYLHFLKQNRVNVINLLCIYQYSLCSLLIYPRTFFFSCDRCLSASVRATCVTQQWLQHLLCYYCCCSHLLPSSSQLVPCPSWVGLRDT